MALVPPIDLPPEAVRAALAPLRNDFSVALVAPGNAFAVGAVIRVAHSFLAREVFIVGDGTGRPSGTAIDSKAESAGVLPARRPSDPGAAPPERGRNLGCDWYRKAAMGMHKYETVVPVGGPDELLRATAGRPLWAVEKDCARRSICAVDRFPEGVVLLFGSERFGIPTELLDRAEEVVGIPMYGVNHSFPVAVAAGIAMHEWARRRYRDGAVV
jgi:tRNA G18 (ribose-2'-O)-methylase SpoU